MNRIAFLGGAGLCLAGLIIFSCSARPGPPQGPVLYNSASDLDPGRSPGEKATLILFGTELDTDVAHEKQDGEITIKLLAIGEELEVEKYKLENSRFYLVQAASETCVPPLPLLEFPVTENQTLEWEGKLMMGTVSNEAKATTVVTKDNLNEKGYSGPSLKSSVTLTFDGGAPKPSERLLTFWFVPGKGILKRTFDKGSTRVPFSAAAGDESQDSKE